MDIFINIMGFCFIPFLMMLLIGGFSEIYAGLTEYFKINHGKISEYSFNLKAYENLKKGYFPSFHRVG